ncbi:MAG: acyltransferase [Candidatus Nanopelagicales bacterium]
MPSPASERVAELDGWRGIAAVMVVVTHVAYVTGFVVSGGGPGALTARLDIGVTVFFLLSGYLLYRPWITAAVGLGPEPSLGTYALRRAARIVPAYVVALVVVLGFLPQAGDPEPWVWAANATFTQIYVPGALVEGFTQTWSVATEVAFYVFLPGIAWVAGRAWRRDPLVGHVAMLVAMVAAGCAFVAGRAFGLLEGWPLSGFWLPGFLDWFALGMLAALLAQARAAGRLPRLTSLMTVIAGERAACLTAGVLIVVLLATPIAGPCTLDPAGSWAVLVKHVGYGAAAAALLLPAFLGLEGPRGPRGRVLASPAATWLGRISYGVFLWHLAAMWAILDLTEHPTFSGGFSWLLPSTLLAAAAVASLSWRFLEQPVLRRAHRP